MRSNDVRYETLRNYRSKKSELHIIKAKFQEKLNHLESNESDNSSQLLENEYNYLTATSK